MAVNNERADQFVLLQHRNGYKCPNAPEFDGSSDFWIVLFDLGRECGRVGAMHYCFCRHHSSKGKVRLERQRPALTIFGEGGWCVVEPN